MRGFTLATMDLSSIARELYSVPLADFIAARKDYVVAARAVDDLQLSKAIGDLRKPSAAAAVVNLLARHDPDLLQEVDELGDELRQAQESGDGSRLRLLNDERKALLRRVSAEAIELAEEHGLSHAPAVMNAVEETIKAALANPRAAEAVRAGLLVSALSGAGLGFVDVSDSVALPAAEMMTLPRPGQRRLRAVPDLPDPAASRIEVAREAVAEATRRTEQADSDLLEAESARETHASERDQLRERIETLTRELRELQARAEDAAGTTRDLDRSVAQSAKARDAAHKELARALQRLDRLV